MGRCLPLPLAAPSSSWSGQDESWRLAAACRGCPEQCRAARRGLARGARQLLRPHQAALCRLVASTCARAWQTCWPRKRPEPNQAAARDAGSARVAGRDINDKSGRRSVTGGKHPDTEGQCYVAGGQGTWPRTTHHATGRRAGSRAAAGDNKSEARGGSAQNQDGASLATEPVGAPRKLLTAALAERPWTRARPGDADDAEASAERPSGSVPPSPPVA